MERQYFVGTSGWHYDHWRSLYYPPGLPKSRWLEHYARDFHTVELNYPFYRLPTERAYDRWRDTSPQGFVFAVKASRYITHVRTLRDVSEPVQDFLERADRLGPKLGPILYQLPPNLHRNDERLAAFLEVLPLGHRHTMEFRHPSWFAEPVFDLLRRHGVGFCAFDLVNLPCPFIVTSDFAYVRFHGYGGKYWGPYPDGEMRRWADVLRGMGPEVQAAYVYFNNDAEAAAVANARTIQAMLADT